MFPIHGVGEGDLVRFFGGIDKKGFISVGRTGALETVGRDRLGIHFKGHNHIVVGVPWCLAVADQDYNMVVDERLVV